MAKIGLTFKNAHSFRDHGLITQSNDRNLLPQVKRQQVDILSLDGKYDLQDETPVYDDKRITVTFTAGFNTLAELRAKSRETSQWLSGRARLIFDDEPDKYYDAKVFDVTALAQTFKTLKITAVFECHPYAYSMNIVTMPLYMGTNPISYGGNARTPTLITLRNNSPIPVHKVLLTAVIRKSGRGTA